MSGGSRSPARPSSPNSTEKWCQAGLSGAQTCAADLVQATDDGLFYAVDRATGETKASALVVYQ